MWWRSCSATFGSLYNRAGEANARDRYILSLLSWLSAVNFFLFYVVLLLLYGLYLHEVIICLCVFLCLVTNVFEVYRRTCSAEEISRLRQELSSGTSWRDVCYAIMPNLATETWATDQISCLRPAFLCCYLHLSPSVIKSCCHYFSRALIFSTCSLVKDSCVLQCPL